MDIIAYAYSSSVLDLQIKVPRFKMALYLLFRFPALYSCQPNG